jgi:hypothetical protein
VSPRIVVLGPGGVQVQGHALHEQPELGLRRLDELLATAPDVAIVTGRAEPCFFRASLALERGVRQVVVHRESLGEAALAHLALRARSFKAHLQLHGHDVGDRVLLRARDPAPLHEVGCPDLACWSEALQAAGNDPIAHAELGWSVAPELRARARSATPLELDTSTRGFPRYGEELAWSAGLKPVLYLVLPAAEASAVRARHPEAHAVVRPDRLSADAATGARSYGAGTSTSHLFLSHDRHAAERALELWVAGSGRHARELGALMGYPPCCVAAFEAFESRGHNAALIYVTAARTVALGAPFHPLLSGVGARLVPFTPCSYGCRSAIAWAELLLRALPSELGARVRRALGRPVLYFDQARAVVLEAPPATAGAAARLDEPGAVRFASARWVPTESAQDDACGATHARTVLAALLAGAGRIRERDGSLEAMAPDGEVRRLGRGRPELGVLLPFDAALLDARELPA